MGYRKYLSCLFLVSSLATCVTAVYHPVREYKGNTFFDRWDFAGEIDYSTLGNVFYMDRKQATSKGLAYINSAGNAIMKVDDTTYIPPAPESQVHRGSIRITSQDTYPAGSLIVLDVRHIPWGCSLWPSFWTIGSGTWPNGGEIDIIEAINLMGFNQYAVHTSPGCIIDKQHAHFTGDLTGINCTLASGCVVQENKPNSYAAGFAQAGGGVYVTKLDVSGIFIWFWSRPDIPHNIKTATSKSTLDPSSWGPPSLALPSTTCDYNKYFTDQRLVFTTTLCGSWAGNPGVYNMTCHIRSSCANDNVIGSGRNYGNAYWEVSYIRTYAAAGSQADEPKSD